VSDQTFISVAPAGTSDANEEALTLGESCEYSEHCPINVAKMSRERHPNVVIAQPFEDAFFLTGAPHLGQIFASVLTSA
jgi:hypothetical protein